MPNVTRGDRYDLRYVRGDHVPRDLAIRESDRITPIDITGWTWICQVREEPDSLAVLATIAVAVTAAALGELTITLSQNDSANPALASAHWDLQRVLPYRLTYVRGRLRPKKDVSR